MPTAAECIEFIRERTSDLSDEELEELLSELQRRLDARRAEGRLESVEDQLLNAADELAEDFATAARIERRNRLINIKVRNDLFSIARRADQARGDPSMGLEAAMVGVNAPFAGARRSVDARQKAIFTEYLGGMVADLRRENLLRTFNSRHMERDIARELEQVTRPDGRPGISGSDEAKRIAAIVDKYRRANLTRQNRAGAWIRPLPGYITRQTHDMIRIRRAGFEAWRDAILPLLDHERTFQGADPEKFLRASYEGLTTGQHLRAEGDAEGDLKFAFKGPGNLARRISQHRVLHFKNADAWFDYNERFGRRSLSEAIVQDLEMGARNTALMETFGPNPRAMFDTVLADLKAIHRGDVEKFDRLSQRRLTNQFAEIDGSINIPGNPTATWWGSAIRAIQTLSKLGQAFLSAIADTAFGAAEIRRQRGMLLGAWSQQLQNFLDGLPTDAVRRETAELIGVGLDGQIGDIASRFSAQDHIPGRISKMQQLFFKLNLLGPWTDANKRGLGLMLARDLAMMSNRRFDDLPGHTQGWLERYGIDARGWDIARQAVREAADGRAYLMPDGIRELPDEAFAGMSARQAQRMRDDIETALRSYYVDRGDFAVPTPGARERAILRQGLQAGTAMGEAIRFMAQFKSFPVTAITRGIGPEVFGTGARSLRDAFINGQADFIGLAHLIVSTTVLGYVAQSAKEIAKGRTPRDPEDFGTWQAAALQGGGLGIYGDFLLGETNRFGRSLPETAVGPAFSELSDLDEIRAKIMAGEPVAASTIRFLMGNAPGVNLFYTRAALDYLIMFQIQEAVNPGYLRRMERRIKREQNQTFLLPPSRAIPRGGGERLLEGVR